MKKLSFVAALVVLLAFTGCTVSEALFSMFGDHYTGGGPTRAEKEYDYNQQIEAARSYQPQSR